MWQGILKLLPEGESPESVSKKYLDETMKIDNYVKNNIYGLMTENEREKYDMYLKLIRKATSKNAWSAAYNLKKSLLYVLRPYNLPRRLQ